MGAPGVSRKVRKWKESPQGLTYKLTIPFSGFSPLSSCTALHASSLGGASDSQVICQKLPQARSTLWPVATQEGTSLDGVRSKPLGLTRLPLTLNRASTLAPLPPTSIHAPATQKLRSPPYLCSCRQIAQGSRSPHNMKLCTHKLTAHVHPTHPHLKIISHLLISRHCKHLSVQGKGSRLS